MSTKNDYFLYQRWKWLPSASLQLDFLTNEVSERSFLHTGHQIFAGLIIFKVFAYKTVGVKLTGSSNRDDKVMIGIVS